MASLSSIPTSFVPHQAAVERRQFSSDFSSAFSFFAYLVLLIVFALALGVFFYGRILSSTQASREAELTKAEAAIDQATVDDFVHLRDRLNSSQSLLGKHVALSNVFSTLQTILPSSVRLSSLHIALDDTGAVKIEGSGFAKSFNSLAFASEVFSADSSIKEVIFSRIGVTKDSTIAFNLAASIDPKLIAYSPSTSVPDLSGMSSVPSMPALSLPTVATSSIMATSSAPAKVASSSKPTSKPAAKSRVP